MIIHQYQVVFIPGIQGELNIHNTINVINYVNGPKDKHHRIIPIDTKKAFGKIQCIFMIKVLESRNGGYIFNIINIIYMKNPSQHHPHQNQE